MRTGRGRRSAVLRSRPAFFDRRNVSSSAATGEGYRASPPGVSAATSVCGDLQTLAETGMRLAKGLGDRLANKCRHHRNRPKAHLKRAYREITIGTREGVRLVYLKGEEPVIHRRIVGRQHRYVPPSLLKSQFETLEEPGKDEHPI